MHASNSSSSRSLVLAGLVATALVILASPAGAISLLNGGFESGAFSPGWTTLPDAYGGRYTGVYGSLPGITPFEGNYFASFSNYAPASSGIEQTVDTTPGQTYTLDSWFMNMPGSDQLNEFKVTWDDNVLLDMINFANITSWTEFSFTVTGTGSDTVSFSGYQNYGRTGLDGIRLDVPGAVPEPAALPLLGLGVLGLMGWRRRRPS